MIARVFLAKLLESALPDCPVHMAMRAVDLSDKRLSAASRARLCWRYFEEVYQPAFPVADEAEDPSIWLPLIAHTPRIPHPVMRILIATRPRAEGGRDGSQILGGAHVEYFRKSKAALITYLCVRPDARGHGVGRFLLDHLLQKTRRLASMTVPVFAEAEDPDRGGSVAFRRTARQRFSILRRLGFRALPIKYRQPALGPGKHPVNNLKLLLFTGGAPIGIEASKVRAFLREFYGSLNAGAPDEARIFGKTARHDLPTFQLGESA